MTSNIVQLKPCGNAALALRNIADQMESGEIDSKECTVIAGTCVFHCGEADDGRAAEGASFNMTMGIHKLMESALSEE